MAVGFHIGHRRWREDQHPRDPAGRFTDADGSPRVADWRQQLYDRLRLPERGTDRSAPQRRGRPIRKLVAPLQHATVRDRRGTPIASIGPEDKYGFRTVTDRNGRNIGQVWQDGPAFTAMDADEVAKDPRREGMRAQYGQSYLDTIEDAARYLHARDTDPTGWVERMIWSDDLIDEWRFLQDTTGFSRDEDPKAAAELDRIAGRLQSLLAPAGDPPGPLPDGGDRYRRGGMDPAAISQAGRREIDQLTDRLYKLLQVFMDPSDITSRPKKVKGKYRSVRTMF